MRNRRKVRPMWALYGLLTCLVVAVSGADLLRQAGSKTLFQLAGDALLSIIMPVVLALVAALIVSRHPRNTIGWLLMVPLGLFVVATPFDAYLGRLAPSAPVPTLPLLLLVWFSSWAWLLLIIPLLHIPLLFPTGQPPTPRWRWVSFAAIAWAALFVLLVTLSQTISWGTMPELTLDNPIGVLDDTAAQSLGGVWIAGLVMLVVLCVAALLARYRHATETEREQIKWLLSACALFLLVQVVGGVSGVSGSTSVAGSIWGVFFGLSLVAIPAAIGIAILRYRLFDIDVIIRRTLVYSLLSAALALVYLSGVVVLQRLLAPLAGEGNQVAVVISTLIIAALFQPLRRRIQTTIDRRFYRRKYDAARTLAGFGARLRDEVEMDRLTSDLLGVVDETLQPAHVSLWLRQPTKR